MKQRTILSAWLGGVAVAGLLSAALPAGAQTREALGTVTAVTPTTLTVKAGARELTFLVDSQTRLEVRSIEKRLQQEVPGRTSPRVSDFFQPGAVVLVRFREEGRGNHALDIRRASSLGPGGGSVSDPEKIAEGRVGAVTESRLTVDVDGREVVFLITRDTEVLARGATRATRAAGSPTPITTFIRVGDLVSVSYHERDGMPSAVEVRRRAPDR